VDKQRCQEMFRKINRANRILVSYCASYRYCFVEEDVKKVTGEAFEEKHVRRFYEDLI
jgi:hypothetical protein